MSPMFQFRHDLRLDYVHVSCPRPVVLQTAADLEGMLDEHRQFFARFHGEKKDLIVDMQSLSAKAAIGAEFNRVRGVIMRDLARRGYRIGAPDPKTLALMQTGEVLTRVQVNLHPTLESAIAAMLADRAADPR